MNADDLLALVQLALLAALACWVAFAGIRLYCQAIVFLAG